MFAIRERLAEVVPGAGAVDAGKAICRWAVTGAHEAAALKAGLDVEQLVEATGVRVCAGDEVSGTSAARPCEDLTTFGVIGAGLNAVLFC